MRSRETLWTGLALGVVLLFSSSCGRSGGDPLAGTSLEGVDLAHPYGRLPPGTQLEGERNFASLMASYSQAMPARVPWVGYWWPYTSNGIANGRYGFGRSPAGKYDAARGGRTSAQAWEIRNHGSAVRGVQGWWGHCNGWCVASALFPEPTTARTVNGITFSVADIKALLSEVGMEASADFFGNRVDWGSDYASPKYDDTVPAQYFLVLTHYMGKLRHPVLIDRYTGDQVWNQPLAGYRFEPTRPEDYLGVAAGAPLVHRVRVKSTLWWGRDDVDPDAVTLPFVFEDSVHFESRTLEMELWLDGPIEFDASGAMVRSGDVIVTREGDHLVGGIWRNGEGFLVDAHPDYMWVPFSTTAPSGEDPYANPHLESEWILSHILPGRDDPSVTPSPVQPAPNPGPSGGPSEPGGPGEPFPIPAPTRRP
jgi:hypothetical protein